MPAFMALVLLIPAAYGAAAYFSFPQFPTKPIEIGIPEDEWKNTGKITWVLEALMLRPERKPGVPPPAPALAEDKLDPSIAAVRDKLVALVALLAALSGFMKVVDLVIRPGPKLGADYYLPKRGEYLQKVAGRHLFTVPIVVGLLVFLPPFIHVSTIEFRYLFQLLACVIWVPHFLTFCLSGPGMWTWGNAYEGQLLGTGAKTG
jgi:hypothetical protein